MWWIKAKRETVMGREKCSPQHKTCNVRPHDQGVPTCLARASPSGFGLGSCITQVLGTQSKSILFSRGNVCPKVTGTRPEVQNSREPSNYAKERKRGSYTGSCTSILKTTLKLKSLVESQ